MTHQVADAEAKEANTNWLYKVSGAAAVVVAGLFVAAAIELILTFLQPAIIKGWLSLLQNNWLIVIFKLHAGFKGIQSSLLYQLNLLDILILALIAIMYVGLYAELWRTSKFWSTIALIQPILGIMLFFATKTTGRSSVMGAELVISIVMLRNKSFDKRIASMGMLSAVLLLMGDVGASMAPSNILAILTGVGYILLMSWLFLVGLRLFQLAQRK